MSKHIAVVREALETTFSKSDDEQECRRADDALSALTAHEQEVAERKQERATLISMLMGIKACAKIDGRPEWLTVAEQIDTVINRFTGDEK